MLKYFAAFVLTTFIASKVLLWNAVLEKPLLNDSVIALLKREDKKRGGLKYI